MGNFEELARGYYLEGLAVSGSTVWYSDVIGGGIHRLEADGTAIAHLEDRRWIGGILLADDGAVLSTGQGGIMRTDPASGKSGWLLDAIDGQRINGVNEMAPDGKGGLYFGTVDLDSIIAGKRPAPVALYRLAPDGSVHCQCDGLGFTNGLALSSDGRRLYCNESFDGTYVHDVAGDGRLSNRRLLLKKPDCDGMVLDADGTLWITGFSSSHIERIAPDGTVLDRLETPAEAITQLRFGGSDGRDLYLTTVPLDAGAGLAKGRLPEAMNSKLLRTRV